MVKAQEGRALPCRAAPFPQPLQGDIRLVIAQDIAQTGRSAILVIMAQAEVATTSATVDRSSDARSPSVR